GQNKILIVPGEVDSQYALNLDKEFSRLHFYTITNGSLGYFPSETAYEDEFDYACYSAPKFYGTIFPFEKKIQRKIDQAIIDLIMRNLYI
ncbi:hypothetical protein N9N67_12550, partial [Bacteriovoracaceae bacterium]|nr:hypothetical protein [Bacteriovoracaceae bacterium]